MLSCQKPTEGPRVPEQAAPPRILPEWQRAPCMQRLKSYLRHSGAVDIDGYANLESWGSSKATVLDLVLNNRQGMSNVADRDGEQFIMYNQGHRLAHVSIAVGQRAAVACTRSGAFRCGCVHLEMAMYSSVLSLFVASLLGSINDRRLAGWPAIRQQKQDRPGGKS